MLETPPRRSDTRERLLALDALADMVSTLVEGGIILSRVLHDGTIMPRQIMLYREFVRTVFSPA